MYQEVKFIARLNETVTMKTVGMIIDEDLMVGWHQVGKTYAVYNQFGYRVVNLIFKNLDCVISFAKKFKEIYGEYLILWYDDPKARIPELTRYTIPHGMETLEVINSLVGEPITYSQFEEAYNARLDT